MNRFRTASAVLVAAMLCVVPGAWSQSNEGRIIGTVRDSTGGVVVAAKITITNVDTHVVHTLVSNSSGDYLAPSLEPGLYTVSVEAAGFKKSTTTPFRLEVSRDARADVQLAPGSVSETVEVHEDATLTDTTNATLQGVLSNKAINELPLQGRDFQNLLPLHPGVQRTPGGGFHSVTSNGNRPDDNNFFIDGADDNDVYYGDTVINGAGISGTPGSILPLDSIQEFNTQESPEADYGVKPGVVMNIGLKSGTDQIHGSAYYFTRNSAADARNFFNTAGQPVADLILHQFGASIGGPIKRDKWFYFFNYEGIRDKIGNPVDVDTPVTSSLESRAGMLPSGTTPADYSIVDAINDPVNGCLALGTCNPQTLALVTGGANGHGVLPINPGFTALLSDPAAINYNFNNVSRGDNVIAKTDLNWNAHNTLNARFIYSNTSQIEEDALPVAPQWLSTASPVSQVFGVGWVWTPNAQWVNELRFSYNWYSETIAPLDANVNPQSYGINTGVTDPRLFGFPRINPGTQTFNYLGGNSSWPLSTLPSQTENISDTVSVNKGRHNLRFGGDFRYGSVKYFRATEGRGRVDFNTLEDFVSGNVDRWEFLYGDPGRNVNLKSFGLFVQDGFRISPRVTLTMGLRYDITYPIEDSRNLLANYVPTAGIVQVGKGISQPYPTNYNNLSPRLGVAWDVFGTGKTVVRAGGGIIFEQPSIRTFMFSGGGLNLNPSGLAGVSPGNGTITSFLADSTDSTLVNWGTTSGPVFLPAVGQSCSSDSPCSIFATSPHLSTPYVANWNLNLQQALGATSMLQVAYVANHGINLYSILDNNQTDPALSTPCIFATGGVFDGDFAGCEQMAKPLTTACPAPVGLGTGGPCFPTLGLFQTLGNHSNSSYNSLQVTFTKRYSHGLYLLAGYTYGHAIDTATSNLASVPQNSLNYRAERGNGDFDIRNRFTLGITYALPSIEGHWQLLKGWQVNTIAMLEGGEPFSLFDDVDDTSSTGEFEDRWNITGPAKNIKTSPTNPIPFIDPSTFTVDGSGNVIGGNQQCINAAGPNNQAALNQLGNYGCFISGNTVITPPAQGTFGNMGRNVFRGPSFKNWDMSVSKTFNLGEKLSLQLRAEAFNILNHPNFDVFTMDNDLADVHDVGRVLFTPDLGESNPVIGSGGSRHIQLGAKFIW
jgi:carboxypeptidase family protein/TonB-dependent receptor-like protein